jgi:7,8-dihydroneopterin aldolase/epimerase/oxygenase
MDKILLNDLKVECIVGIWEWERRVPQIVILDLELATDVRKAAASDSIEDAVDYKQAADRVREFVAQSQFKLLESLAENTAQLLLRELRVSWVRVKVVKPGALGAGAKVSVVIERTAG